MDRIAEMKTRSTLPAMVDFGRRGLLRAGLGALALCCLGGGRMALAQGARYLRIATGSAAGTYFPVGETIARLLSHPPGMPPCDPDAPCGVPDLIATSETSEGSVANVTAVATGAVETALAQADVISWAQTGTGLFADQPAMANLRVIANLYTESMHLVVRRDANITRVQDLKGKRVSLDRPGSGSRVDALLILAAHGVKQASLKVVELGPAQASDALANGEIDAFFFLGGAPAATVLDIAGNNEIDLVPITGEARQKLLSKTRYFTASTIPAGTYPGIGDTETLSVGAQWICAVERSEDLIYEITRTLFDPVNRPVLETSHPKAREISLDTALDGIAVALHPGAARFYREKGIPLPPDAI